MLMHGTEIGLSMAIITLKDLAEKLNLSTSTVSRALNDSHEISIETKQRVRAAAKKYNYKPNLLAKSLKTGRSNTIGLLVPSLITAFQIQVLEGAQQAALKHNMNLICMQSREDHKIEKESLHTFLQQNVDGIIISPCVNTDTAFLQHINAQIPMVMVDRIDVDVDTHKIGVNSERGAFEATQHLIDSGRRDILVLTAKNIGINAKRLLGYKKALSANGIPEDPSKIIQVDYAYNPKDLLQVLHVIIDRKLRDYPNPIGILGLTDTLTVNLLGVLLKLGIRVPEQVSLIGFANINFAESFNPSLSTIIQPANEMGITAFNHLMQMIEAKKFPPQMPERIILDPEIILRNSSINLLD